MKVLKSWGTSGEVVVSILSSDSCDFDKNEPVFIEFDGLPVPFFIEEYQPKGGRLIVKFEDIDTMEAAEELVGREIRFQNDGDEEEDDSLVGIRIINAADGKKVGTVTECNNYAGNLCITVLTDNGKEIILPLHEDLIEKIGKTSLILTIPEGLL